MKHKNYIEANTKESKHNNCTDNTLTSNNHASLRADKEKNKKHKTTTKQ